MTTYPHRLLLLLAPLSVGCGSPESPPPTPAAEEAPPIPEGAERGAERPPHAPEPGALVQGTLEAPEGATGAAVFVSLKIEGQPGPPLAAKRLPPGPFPLSFTLTEADRPMAKGPVPDRFQLKATLDADGDPMTKGPDDLEIVATTDKGTADLSLILAPRAE
ncbi:MAG TPA: hypothetical protein ENK18_13785 [Deltaproteobacteria bacterium]|nr:hypothetical protein [Deltaproteobacteria bacterium]